MKRRLPLALLLACLAPSASAASESPPKARFEHLTVEHGLSDSRVRALLIDRRGFLWIRTVNGLDRYDGYEFRVFQHDPANPATIGSDFVRALHEDREGHIWVGTIGGGLSRWDPSTETFNRYVHDPTDPQSLSNDRVRAICEDDEGALWIGTAAGLSRLDPRTGRFDRFQTNRTIPRASAMTTSWRSFSTARACCGWARTAVASMSCYWRGTRHGSSTTSTTAAIRRA